MLRCVLSNEVRERAERTSKMISVMKQLLRKALEIRKLGVMTDIFKIMKAVDEVIAEWLFIPRTRRSMIKLVVD